MTRGQFLSLTTRQRTCCTICYSEGNHAVLVAGVTLGEKMGSPAYWRKAYRSLEKHLKVNHVDHPAVRRLLGGLI